MNSGVKKESELGMMRTEVKNRLSLLATEVLAIRDLNSGNKAMTLSGWRLQEEIKKKVQKGLLRQEHVIAAGRVAERFSEDINNVNKLLVSARGENVDKALKELLKSYTFLEELRKLGMPMMESEKDLRMCVRELEIIKSEYDKLNTEKWF